MRQPVANVEPSEDRPPARLLRIDDGRGPCRMNKMYGIFSCDNPSWRAQFWRPQPFGGGSPKTPYVSTQNLEVYAQAKLHCAGRAQIEYPCARSDTVRDSGGGRRSIYRARSSGQASR